MGLPAAKHRYTIAEYLELEEKSEGRNEFHDGEIFAMAGGAYTQTKIMKNLIVALDKRMGNGPCEPLGSEMRVRIPTRQSYVYPDTTVICEQPIFDPDDAKKTTIINPKVIFEILSESTEAYDRGEKFSLYRELESFKEYVLIAQDKPRVESFFRQPDGGWNFQYVDGLDATLRLKSIQIDVPLSEIYRNVTFEPKSPRTPTDG